VPALFFDGVPNSYGLQKRKTKGKLFELTDAHKNASMHIRHLHNPICTSSSDAAHELFFKLSANSSTRCAPLDARPRWSFL
jgi:hypothetical protein